MNQQRGFPTVTELIETILSNARYVIPDDQKDQQAEKIDPTTIPRTQSVHEILRNAIQHHLAEPSQEAAESLMPQARAEFLDDQKELRGIELRHPEVWFRYPAEVLHAQLDAMMYRNQQIKGVITPQDFADWLVQFGADERTPEELHKKSQIREALNEAWHMDTESRTPVSPRRAVSTESEKGWLSNTLPTSSRAWGALSALSTAFQRQTKPAGWKVPAPRFASDCAPPQMRSPRAA